MICQADRILSNKDACYNSARIFADYIGRTTGIHYLVHLCEKHFRKVNWHANHVYFLSSHYCSVRFLQKSQKGNG